MTVAVNEHAFSKAKLKERWVSSYSVETEIAVEVSLFAATDALSVNRYLISIDPCCRVEALEGTNAQDGKDFLVHVSQSDPLSVAHLVRCAARNFGVDQPGIPRSIKICWALSLSNSVSGADVLDWLEKTAKESASTGSPTIVERNGCDTLEEDLLVQLPDLGLALKGKVVGPMLMLEYTFSGEALYRLQMLSPETIETLSAWRLFSESSGFSSKMSRKMPIAADADNRTSLPEGFGREFQTTMARMFRQIDRRWSF